MTHTAPLAYASANAVMSKRQLLWNSGYRPVAVYTKDKKPFGNNWTGRSRRSPSDAATESPVDGALNTGILCDGLRAVDCDVDDPAVSSELERLARTMLGPAPIRKRSDSSRFLMLYRASIGEPSKRVLKGHHGKVELLGRGQQFVAYGLHPSGTQYQWDFDPSLYSRELLSAVSEQQLTAFFQAISAIIGARTEDAIPSETPSPVPFDPSQPLSERDYAYAAQALRMECEQLAAFSSGERNNQLNESAFAMGTLVANGSIEESKVLEALYHSMITNRHVAEHGEHATLATLHSGLNAGKAKPRPRLGQTDLPPVEIGLRIETPTTISKPSQLCDPFRNGKRAVTLRRGSDIESVPNGSSSIPETLGGASYR